jgi:hypothetical protein
MICIDKNTVRVSRNLPISLVEGGHGKDQDLLPLHHGQDCSGLEHYVCSLQCTTKPEVTRKSLVGFNN